ncbi:MAG TPA: glycosyltransferase [Terriglobales bacterium]
MRNRNPDSQNLRVAFFPDVYHEVDGVANTSRHFEAFAQKRDLPFLTVHAGPRNKTATAGSVTRIQVRRSLLTFPLDQTHEYDLALWWHYREVLRSVRDFDPDIVQITGPSDLGMLGALVAHKLRIPLVASWQTNVHEYARCRLAGVLSFLPDPITGRLLSAVERWCFRAAARFYKIPRLVFAPNREMVERLAQATGKPCFLMSHSVDTAVFSPGFRNRSRGPFTIGYVGRLTAEKNVRQLAQLERALLARGHQNFRIVVVGGGAEITWLRNNLCHAEFTGVLTGKSLSQAFANMDLFVFPSETDTFGLAVLEALSSGVPAVVTAGGGPKFTVQQGKTGWIANNFDDFVNCAESALTQPDLLSRMSSAARDYALSTSWEKIFEDMYRTYESCFYSADAGCHEIPHAANA